MNGLHESRDAGRAATGRDVPAGMLHGVSPDLRRLTAAAPPQGLRVARVREVSLSLHLPARPFDHYGKPPALVDAEVGALP